MKRRYKKNSSFALSIILVLVISATILPGNVSAQAVGTPCTVARTGAPGTWQQSRTSGGGVFCAASNQVAAAAAAEADSCGITNIGQCFSDVILLLPGYVALTTLKIAQWFTHISGMMLNYVVYYTVVNMKANISDAQTLSDAWRTIRDVGNMGFIFILLYAAIRTIVGGGGDNQKLVARVVVVAILINFSLFFTRFIIDISNVLAITFYDAIAPGALDKTFTQGLSGSLMEPLRLQSIFDVSSGLTIFSGEKIFIIGVAGTIFSLIAAFVFFAISILLIIRFVVLVFVMILSPIAFLSFILPQMKGYATQWWNALSGQAFFAPIYFLLTWVVIVVSRSMLKGGSFANLAGTSTAAGGTGAPPLETIEMIVNFAIVISMLVFSLVTAKNWANKAPGGISKIASMATGAIYGGAVGWAGRRTIGWGGSVIADRADLQKAANEGTGVRGAAARLALYTAKKARSGTFDARNATIPTNALGDAVRGTAGRTALGKKLGLDRTEFASISAGAYAAAATGSGTGVKDGFVERRDAKTKRMEAERKKASDEYRMVEGRAAIESVVDKDGNTKATATAIEISEMQKVVKEMSTKEVTALEANTLANEKVAEALTVNHLKAIDDDKEGRFSEENKNKIFEKHFNKVNEAVTAMADPTIWGALSTDEQNRHKNTIRNISSKEMEYVPTSIFDPNQLSAATPEGEKSRQFLKSLLFPQVEDLLKGDKLLASEKIAVREERERPLREAFALGSWATVKDIMQKMPEPALVVMEANYNPATPNVPTLDHPEVVGIYSPSVLNKMAAQAGFGAPKRNAVRAAVLDKVTGPTADPRLKAAFTALTTPRRGMLRVTPADRQTVLTGLANDEERRLVTSAEWLESENGQQIF